jgi:hypothetical protein
MASLLPWDEMAVARDLIDGLKFTCDPRTFILLQF